MRFKESRKPSILIDGAGRGELKTEEAAIVMRKKTLRGRFGRPSHVSQRMGGRPEAHRKARTSKTKGTKTDDIQEKKR